MTKRKSKTPDIEINDEVSLQFHTSWEDAHIHKIKNGQVWLRHSREPREDEKIFGPFYIESGKAVDTSDDWLGMMFVLFDGGWESQHYEDVSLGEGDTL